MLLCVMMIQDLKIIVYNIIYVCLILVSKCKIISIGSLSLI